MRLINADELIERIASIPDLRTLNTKTIGQAIDKCVTYELPKRPAGTICRNCGFWVQLDKPPEEVGNDDV